MILKKEVEQTEREIKSQQHCKSYTMVAWCKCSGYSMLMPV